MMREGYCPRSDSETTGTPRLFRSLDLENILFIPLEEVHAFGLTFLAIAVHI
jgi:hypothetical protein